MPTAGHFKGLFTRRHVRRRRLALAALTLGLLIAAAGYYATRPARLGAFAARMLESVFRGTEASLDTARFTWSGKIELRGLKLRVPTLPGPSGDLFEAQQAVLHIDPWSLLSGQAELKRLAVIRPVLGLTEVAPDRFNFEVLRDLNKSQPRGVIARVPRVLLQDGVVRYGEITKAGEFREVGRLALTGRLDPDATKASLYHFELYEDRPGPADVRAQIRGRFDLTDLSVQADLSDFALANPHRNMLPAQVRRWWDEFEPAGAISGIKFHYDEKLGPQAEVKVQDVELTLPQLASAGYKARMTGVSGLFRFDDKTVRVEGLTGQIEGVQYKIDGKIDGYSADAPFTLFLQTRPFHVPEEPRYVLALPDDIQQVFKMLTPVGWMSVSVTAYRQDKGGNVVFRGKSTILSGRELVAELRSAGRAEPMDPADPLFSSKGKYFKFPYEVTNCRGLITFASDGVDVQNLVGDTPGGGSLTIRGKILPPYNDPMVDLTISAIDIAIDPSLYHAMKDTHREATQIFFDEPAWRRLRDAGHFKGGGGPMPAEAHPFDLGGLCNALVTVRGPAGNGKMPAIAVDIELTRANAVFKFFPYPLRVTRGRLRLDGDQAEFQNVLATGLHGGRIRLDGKIDLPDNEAGRPLTPRLGLHASGFPIDPLLFDVLDGPRAQRFRDLRLAGKVDVDGTIFRDDEADRIDMDMAVVMNDGSAAPGSGRYKLDNLRGRLTVTLDGATIEQITASHDRSRVELAGRSTWAQDKPSTLEVHAKASDLRFDDPVLDLVGFAGGGSADADRFWAQRNPAGVFDADADYRAVGENSNSKIVLRPKSLAFDQSGARVEFPATTGAAVIESDRLTLDHFIAQFDGGVLKLDGSYPLSLWERAVARVSPDPASAKQGAETATFSLSLTGDRITETLIHLMPARVADLLTTLQFSGRYALDLPTLKIGPNTFSVAGSLKLWDAAARIGIAVEDFTGQVDLSASNAADGNRLVIDASLHADRLRLADRPIEDLNLGLRTLPESQALRLYDLRGRCADGLIGGHGVISPATGDYELRVALANAQLDRFTAATPPPSEGDPPPRPRPAFTGLLSASLDLEGSWKDATRLRGRGSLAVRNGDLHEVPLAFGLLSVSHLRLPVATKFDTAILSYYMLHDRIVFESIEMAAPSMRLVGKGQMALPSRELDISLTTSNPNGLDLGPLTELIAKLRNQLVTLRIGGTLDHPETRVQQFNGISQAWEDIFGPKAKPARTESKP